MDQISEIKQKLNVVDVVGGYVTLTKAGKNYKGLCPFHSEKTPSFMVSPELQIYKCFGCGESGDIFTFVQRMDGIEFAQALEVLAEKAGVVLEKRTPNEDTSKRRKIYEINHLSTEFYHELLVKHPVGKKALQYLTKERKFSKSTIEAFKLGYAPNSWDILSRFLKKQKYVPADMLLAGVVISKRSGKGLIDKFRGRIVFPFIDVSGKIVGFSGRTVFDRSPKYLNTAETLVFRKSDFVYGLHENRTLIKKEGAIFVEGPTDVLSSYQTGVKNVVASSGTSLTLGQLGLIARYTKDVTFCFDSDPAGVMAAQRAAALAEKKGFNIKVALVPEEYKDLDAFIAKDPAKAKAALKKAVPVYDFFVTTAIKKYGTGGSIEKRKIVEDLTPVLSKISDPVVLEHYIRRLAKELGIREEVLSTVFEGKAKVSDFTASFGKEGSHDAKADALKTKEAYILALLLKTNIDNIHSILYKLGKKDFARADAVLQQTFGELKKFVKSKRTFKIKGFIDTIGNDLKSVVQELYLWDVGDLVTSEEGFLKELKSMVALLRKGTIKDEVHSLSEALKLAEMSKDMEEVTALSKKIRKLTKELI